MKIICAEEHAIDPATDKVAQPAVLDEAPYFGLIDSPNAAFREKFAHLNAEASTRGNSPTQIPATCTVVTICGTSASSSSAKATRSSATERQHPQ